MTIGARTINIVLVSVINLLQSKSLATENNLVCMSAAQVIELLF